LTIRRRDGSGGGGGGMGWLGVYSEDGSLGERRGEGVGGVTELLVVDVV